mmetsp:Transcript_20644/g.55725  ORF Transcript_20644/g.55725 Transcript_20644/m.55725 type:complete len:253 (+) Transcript_20644:639-1397(+)
MRPRAREAAAVAPALGRGVHCHEGHVPVLAASGVLRVKRVHCGERDVLCAVKAGPPDPGIKRRPQNRGQCPEAGPGEAADGAHFLGGGGDSCRWPFHALRNHHCFQLPSWPARAEHDAPPSAFPAHAAGRGLEGGGAGHERVPPGAALRRGVEDLEREEEAQQLLAARIPVVSEGGAEDPVGHGLGLGLGRAGEGARDHGRGVTPVCGAKDCDALVLELVEDCGTVVDGRSWRDGSEASPRADCLEEKRHRL